MLSVCISLLSWLNGLGISSRVDYCVILLLASHLIFVLLSLLHGCAWLSTPAPWHVRASMNQVNIIPWLNFLFWSNSMTSKVTAVAVLSGVNNHDSSVQGPQHKLIIWWIPPNIKKFLRLMFEGQSRHWSWREFGYSIKKIIPSLPQNQPWSTSMKDRWSLEWPTQSPDLNIIENMWRDLKQAVHARRLKNIPLFWQEQWGNILKVRIERFCWLKEALIVLTGPFSFFYLFWNCKKLQ